jgi:hypothetical protein
VSVTRVPFSQLIQQPKSTVGQLESSPDHRLRLARRDGEDLILESAGQSEAKDALWSATSRLFMSLVSNDEGARVLLLALPEVFPWVRFLPKSAVQRFLVELVETAYACAELDTVAPIEAVVTAWRNTANVHADPELHRMLTEPLDGADHGDVPVPGES